VKDSFDSRMVVYGLLFYGLVLGVCLVAAWLWPEAAGLPWGDPSHAVRDVALGLATGGTVIAVSWAMVRWLPSGRRLADLLARTLKGMPRWAGLPLAVAAGVAEEAAFRGCAWSALQAWLGTAAAWVLTSVVFGLAHGMFQRGMRTWSAFALATGFALGGLRLWTGSILAAIVAHVLVDAVNLPLVRRAGAARSPEDE